MQYLLSTSRVKLVAVFTLLFFSVPSFSESTPGLDPTKPLFGSKRATVVKVANTLALESIFRSGSKATAIINGKALKLNDSIEDYRLIRINKDNVILRSSEKELKLSLFSSVTKK